MERVVAKGIMRLADSASMPQVRAIASLELERLAQRLRQTTDTRSVADEAHETLLARDIQRFLERPAPPVAQPLALPEPPGSPIGDPGLDYSLPVDSTCSVWWWDETPQ